MWFIKLYLICLIKVSQSINEDSWNRFTKIECTSTDPNKSFKSHFCFVKNYNRNLSTINLGFTTRKPMDNVMLDHQIFYKFMTNYRQIVHMPKIDICQVLKNVDSNLLLKTPLLNLKAAFPNADFKCPFKELILNNITAGMMSTTHLFPAGQYKNVYIFSNDEGFVFRIVTSVLNFSKDKVEF